MPLPKGGKRQRHEGKKHLGGLYEKAITETRSWPFINYNNAYKKRLQFYIRSQRYRTPAEIRILAVTSVFQFELWPSSAVKGCQASSPKNDNAPLAILIGGNEAAIPTSPSQTKDW
jgi:hypothetical protein